MAGGEDWLLRPVVAGMCHYESLRDGTLRLIDVAIMNEALDVQEENRARIMESVKRG